MTRRLVLAIGLAVLIITLTTAIEIQPVMAPTVVESDSCSNTQDNGCVSITMISNAHAIDEGSYNLTFPRNSRFKHRFPIDFSNETPDFSRTASDTTIDVETITIPEFPSFLLMLLFMAASLLGVTLFKIRVRRSSTV